MLFLKIVVYMIYYHSIFIISRDHYVLCYSNCFLMLCIFVPDKKHGVILYMSFFLGLSRISTIILVQFRMLTARNFFLNLYFDLNQSIICYIYIYLFLCRHMFYMFHFYYYCSLATKYYFIPNICYFCRVSVFSVVLLYEH